MGYIYSNEFELNQTVQLKKALKLNLRQDKKAKKIIQLKGKSSLVFSNLAVLTLASCGGGGGSSAPVPVTTTPSFSNQSFTFSEDTMGNFDLDISNIEGDDLTITVDSIPVGGIITTSAGTTLVADMILSVNDLTGLIFTPDANKNSDQNIIGDLVLTITNGSVSNSSTISIIVNAINDAPTLGTVGTTNVLETVAANVTLLTLPGNDVDDDSLSYYLNGPDATLFQVDSSGNISFKTSPNFKNPGDSDLNNLYVFNLVTKDPSGAEAISEIYINVLDVKPKGQAIDGYLVGATVWVDLDGDGIQDADEPFTSTDKTGAFEFEDDIPVNTNIYVEGGYDLGTGKPNEQTLKLTTAIEGDGTQALIVSPVSTQISRAYFKMGVTLEQAQAKIGAAYGLSDAFPNLTNFDPIDLAYSATSNTQAQDALTAQARNIMISSMGELSKKVSEYFSTEIAPTVRTQISDIFSAGTQTLRNSSWDSGVDLTTQPRIVIELEGFEDLLASTSDTFNDKIIEAILASDDLAKIFEMKSDGTGQFDTVIAQATDAIILEIKNLILSEMGFDPATGFTTFKSLDGYTGETVTFLGSTKTMGEWAVIMVDILDSQMPDPFSGRVNFGPEGGVTDMVGKYYAEQIVKIVRLMETMTGLTFENLTDAQIDQLVDMGFEYNRGATFNDSYSRWIPFDEYGQELWSQAVYLNYSGERFRYDSNGDEIQGNTGQWLLTAGQVKEYLKNPAAQLNTGNWGNDFNTYNWTVSTGDLGMYLALAEARTPDEVKILMDALTATPDSIKNFTDILTASFTQGTKVFTNLVTGALDFTLDKFTNFVEKTLDYRNDEVWLPKEILGIPVSTVQTVTLSDGSTKELETMKGISWMVGTWGQTNIGLQESGSYSYAITGGPDATLFRISDEGTIAFKDTAPNASSPNDSDTDGKYLITVTVTDNFDGFTQEIEFVLKFPDWDDSRTYVASQAPSVATESLLIQVDEHSTIGEYGFWDEETSQTIWLREGIEIFINGIDGIPAEQIHVRLQDRDESGNPIKDNNLFWLDQEGGKFYLKLRDGVKTLDYESPKDNNGDNIYELLVFVEIKSNGSGNSLAVSQEIIIEVKNIDADPAPSFPGWWVDDQPNHFIFTENKAPVATISTAAIDGKTLDNIFVSGEVRQIDHDWQETQITTIADLDAKSWSGQITSEITGGADADLFYVRDSDYGSQFFFKTRPDFTSPTDANGDNIYEFELTKTTSSGDSITKIVRVEIQATPDGEQAAPDPVTTALVFSIDELAEKIGREDGGSRSVVGTDAADNFTQEEIGNGFKYISGGAGDDIFDAFREGYLTGGDGADIFQITGDHMENPATFGIRDYSTNWSSDMPEGINGYDQNRDGVLDLATELDWSRVALISDFTPGTDKLALTTFGWTGQNVPTLRKTDVSFVQGTGNMADHTLVLVTGQEALNRGFTDGGLVAVLLDTDAATISMDTDVIEAGASYEITLGNIGTAIGALTTTVKDTDGLDVPVLQLPNGEYIWVYMDGQVADNTSFYSNFALTSDGVLYVPRRDNLDFESPKDGNKDNIYELLFYGQTFTELVLEKQPWGGYWIDWDNSVSASNIAFNIFIDVNDDISDNVGKISIAEANFMNDDGTLNVDMIDLVFSQISAVQGSLMDIDMKAIAEEISFDFSFFAMADARTQSEDWFGNYQADSFRRFNEELESTFERNLLSKFSTYTSADSFSNLTGTSGDDTISGAAAKETIFGKKGNDTILGGEGDDVIFGEQGNDILDGGPGADAIDGGAGADKIIVGEGLDVLDGGSGDDIFDFTNITNLPEYVKGGSGTDTLVLAGLSNVGLETDDGTDSDNLPDYTGIDLNKLVSIKETWTYIDESGSVVNEEGWRNRVESIEAIDLRDLQSSINAGGGTTVFNDVLNISFDALQRMSWDNKTWTIRGDNTDTVRLLGHEWAYNDGSTLKTQFEPFRYKGITVEDGVTYNVYELWDGRVQIEAGITVVFTKRDLGKAIAGENVAPDFWYQWTTVYENSIAVFGAVKNSWDRDGDTLTYSLDQTYPDAALFNIDASTGEITFKVAPNYEAPVSISSGASSVGTEEANFANFDAYMLRQYNQYRIKVIADDSSGESNAQTTQDLYIDVRNLPDYAGYDSSNKIPFFKDMWGSGAKFIDDAAVQEIQIKGFDLDFDTLTWELLAVELWGDNFNYIRYGSNENGDSVQNAIGDAPFTLTSTGVLKPNSTLSYETGPTTVKVYVSLTDGKSDAIKKTFYFNIEDTIEDGSLTVKGTAMIGSYALGAATVWQDLDNDGVKDDSEPSTTTNTEGRFTLAVSKSDQDVPILASGGTDMGSGLQNTSILKINSNLKLTSGRDWGEYSLSPISTVSLSMQGIDRSISDKQTMTDASKAFGMNPLWMEGDGNFYGERFYDIKNRLDGQSNIGEWETFNLNVFTLNNLINLIGNAAIKAGVQIINDALADVNTKVSGTSNVSSFSAGSLTSSQTSIIQQASYQAAMDAIAELVTGKTTFDGFRLAESNPVTITDHEGSTNVKHTPSFTVASNVLTLNSSNIEVNQSSMQDALDLNVGAKGLTVEVELGTLPTTAQTIEFTGKLIDGTDGSIDSGERAIEVRFQVLVDPSQEVGSTNYVYVPDSADLTIVYTGEDGITTSTTLEQSGNMVKIVTSDTGVPKFVVDFNEVFKRGIPETDLSTYFTTSTASNGNYYAELTFNGASLKTASGDSFNKVVAPFKIAATTTPVVYFEDITVSEARGWNQITLTLSKPATETFTLEYNINEGTATPDEDFWWWSDDTGYRSITFVAGQSTAVINVDVRNDSQTEGDETIIYGLRIASDSENKVILSTTTTTVTIEDDESSSGINYETLVDKILTALQPTLGAQLKVLTDANTANLSSSSTTFTDILLSNSDISDISTYLTTEISEDVTLYDPVLTGVMNLINTYVSAARGPSGIQEGLKINGKNMATDFAAIANAIDTLVLSEFTSTSVSAMNQTLIDDIYGDSGFKYTGDTTVSNGALVYARTVDATSNAYSDTLYPTGSGLRDTTYQKGSSLTLGTSGNDTVDLNTENANTIYLGGDGNDDITISGNQSGSLIYGGAGNDIIKDTNSYGNNMLLDGGLGDDKLYSNSQHQIKFKGGDGSDVFIIEYNNANYKWDSGSSFQGSDQDGNQQLNYDEYWDIQGVVIDFEDGTDKIGLRGSDWNGKTIVVAQGTGDMSSHTFLLTGSAEKGGDSDVQYWLILWNTTASNITSDDFVLVDSNYATSSLSGVTISTNLADAGYSTEDGVLKLDGSSMSFSIPSFNIIDSSDGINFENIDVGTENHIQILKTDDGQFDLNEFRTEAEDRIDNYSILGEIEEEELLFIIDSI